MRDKEITKKPAAAKKPAAKKASAGKTASKSRAEVNAKIIAATTVKNSDETANPVSAGKVNKKPGNHTLTMYALVAFMAVTALVGTVSYLYESPAAAQENVAATATVDPAVTDVVTAQAENSNESTPVIATIAVETTTASTIDTETVTTANTQTTAKAGIFDRMPAHVRASREKMDQRMAASQARQMDRLREMQKRQLDSMKASLAHHEQMIVRVTEQQKQVLFRQEATFQRMQELRNRI